METPSENRTQPTASTHGDSADVRPQPGEVAEFCRLVARILRRRNGQERLAQEAGGSVAITEYSQSEIETSEGPE